MHTIFTLLFYSRILPCLCILSTVYKDFGYEVFCTIHKHSGFECVDTVSSNTNILRMRCRCPQDIADTLQASLERQKLKFYFFPKKCLYFLMFITAVCFLFLLKNQIKSIYDFKMFCFRQTYLNPSCFA